MSSKLCARTLLLRPPDLGNKTVHLVPAHESAQSVLTNAATERNKIISPNTTVQSVNTVYRFCCSSSCTVCTLDYRMTITVGNCDLHVYHVALDYRTQLGCFTSALIMMAQQHYVYRSPECQICTIRYVPLWYVSHTLGEEKMCCNTIRTHEET